MAGGKPVGYLQVQLGSWTRDYQDQIQWVVRASLEPGISGSQGKRPNHWATLSPASQRPNPPLPRNYLRDIGEETCNLVDRNTIEEKVEKERRAVARTCNMSKLKLD